MQHPKDFHIMLAAAGAPSGAPRQSATRLGRDGSLRIND